MGPVPLTVSSSIKSGITDGRARGFSRQPRSALPPLTVSSEPLALTHHQSYVQPPPLADHPPHYAHRGLSDHPVNGNGCHHHPHGHQSGRWLTSILEPDRRHDSPEEKMNDEIRAQINASHRFESFADQRSENAIKCRPPAAHPEWRLDRLLKRKAEQGVKVDTVEFWSHHEKVVVVDNHHACIGGLDLCFGRWDTHNHPLADAHPTDFSRTLFPGQDYNNARVLDFQDVGNYVSNAISILETARMPWHDVHMTICGSVVLDICQHFVERWNEVKRRKYRDKEYALFDFLLL
ncbi:hypothetical protein BJ138DRAFT_1130429 [Hygrophoropsis aurantiaca]|uniref:Uncharacterized protein n=1 Tax=Hygrophoropsis aurantiaca TaxID=72124 RepID=A0ACB7ZXE0_9AGAM|nr:hypothetical protein BJ138DRAFT_1130429 [Hygrophoropsis aurantiaca]